MNECSDLMWLQEYERLMFGELHSIETMSVASDMKHQHMPAHLFKYRSCNQNSFEALKYDFLFSSQPKEFNDIFEGPIEIFSDDAKKNIYQKTYNKMRADNPFLPERKVNSHKDFLQSIAIGFGGSYDDLKQNCKEFPLMQRMENIIDARMNDLIRKLKDYARNQYNICCFCSENDNVGMWAHYADNNKGFCIGYDIKNLNNDLTHLTFPVIYKDECTLSVYDIDDINGSDCMHILTTKTMDWRNEKEWRTFFPAYAPIHKEQMPTAKTVYLGARIDKKHEIQLQEICIEKGIKLYKMIPQLSNHALVAEPF